MTARTVLRTAALVVAVLAAAVPTAQARKVGNPSPPDFYMELPKGFIQIVGSGGAKITTFKLDFAANDQPNPSLRGTIDNAGNVVIPPAQVIFPPQQLDTGDGVINATFLATEAWTGVLNPLTGRLDLRARLRVQLTGVAQGFSLGNNCFVASVAQPLDMTLSTHLGTAPTATTLRSISYLPDPADPLSFPGGAFSGQAYSDEAGTWPSAPGVIAVPTPRPAGSVRVVNDTFAVAGASGCGPLSAANGPVNDQLGLPTTAGASRAAFDVIFVPGGSRTGSNIYPSKGVKAFFTAPGVSTAQWPAEEVPTIPTAVSTTIDASGSTFSAGPNPGGRFAYDLGTGTFGAFTNTTSQNVSFATPGTRTLRLQARDADGDIDTRTRQIEVVQSTDIGVGLTGPPGGFRGGSDGSWSIDVTNTSGRANTQPITMTDVLPAGTSFVSATGAGWSCSEASGTVTCTRGTGTLAAGATSTITLTVAVSPSAATPLTNTASVAQLGDPASGNDSASVDVAVRKTDLALTKSHTATFTANGVHPYTLEVENVGDADTVGATTVVDTLPAGMTYVASGSGGSGWTCATGAGPDQVTCTRSATIAAGETAPPITLRVRVAASASGTLTNEATVSAQGDTDAFGGSDDASDPTAISVVPDLTVLGSAGGSFTVGDPGTTTLTVRNEAVVDADGPTDLRFTLPDGLTVSAVSGSGWDCAATTLGGPDVDCTYAATIPAQSDAPDVTLTVDVAHGAYPSTTIEPALVSAVDGYAANDTTSITTTVRRLDVAILKTALRGFSVGVEGIYRLSVANEGDADTVGATTVTDVLPDTLRLRSTPTGAGWNCSASDVGAQDVSCVRTAPIVAGTSAPLITVRVTVLDEAAEDGSVENTAYVDTARDTRGVSADDPVTGNNDSTAITSAVSVDVAVEAAHIDPFRVGTVDEIALKVRNVGAIPTVPGEPVTVTEVLPTGLVPRAADVEVDRAGWSCDVDEQTVTCAIDPADGVWAMEPGQTASILVPVDVTDAAEDDSTATATVTTEKDASVTRSPNNQAVSEIDVQRVDLAVDASQSVAPLAGSIGEVTVDVENVGTHATLDPTTVTVSLPTGLTYRSNGSTTAGWTCSPAGTTSEVECVRTASIAAGAPAPDLKLRTDVGTTAPAGWDVDVEVSTAAEPSTRLDDNDDTFSVTLQRVDLALHKTHDPESIQAGRQGTFTLHVTNEGNRTTSKTITVADTVDPAFTRPRAVGPGWTCTTTGQLVRCTRTAPLAPGAQTPPIALRVDIPTASSGTVDSGPVARVSSEEDPYTGNDTATDPAEIMTTPDLELVKEQPENLVAGDRTTVTYRVTNVGASESDGSPTLRLRDDLGGGMVPVDTTTTDAWDCDLADRKVACDLIMPLEPGQSAKLKVTVEVGRDAVPGRASMARISSGEDPNWRNDRSLGVSVVDERDLEVSATGPTGGFVPNLDGVLVAAAKNVGTAPVTGQTTIRYALPAGAFFKDSGVYGTGWGCRLIARDVVCDRTSTIAPGASTPNLQLTIIPSSSNVPKLTSTFTVSTDGDLNAANNSVTREDAVTAPTPTTPTTPTTPAPPPPPPSAPATGTALGARLVEGAITLSGIEPLRLTDGMITLSGTVGADGALSVPTSGMTFRAISLPLKVGPLDVNAKIILQPLGDATGTLPPAGGDATFSVPVRVKVEAYGTDGTPLLGTTSACFVEPLQFDLRGTYDAAARRVTVSSDAVSVPTAGSGCGALGDQVNTLLGLPSATNKVSLTFSLGGTGSPVAETATSTGPAPVPAVAGIGKVVVRGSTVWVPVTCKGTTGACTGALRLTGSLRPRKGAKPRTTTMASRSFSFQPGSGDVVPLRLNSSIRSALRRAGKKGVAAKLTLTPRGVTKPTKTVTVRVRGA